MLQYIDSFKHKRYTCDSFGRSYVHVEQLSIEKWAVMNTYSSSQKLHKI